MKLLSVVIPCYNSEELMGRAIESLLPAREHIEILLVDDGSEDNTYDIASQYSVKYPDIVKVFRQEKTGYGEAINTALDSATGLYFKILHYDDWFEEKALRKVMKRLEALCRYEMIVDLFITNYVFDKELEKKHSIMDYKSVFPQDQIFHWKEMKHLKQSQYLLVHSVLFRTELLKDCGLKMPRNMCYVDNYFVYKPLPSVRTMYYMNTNLYHYRIKENSCSTDESITEDYINEQIDVLKKLIASHTVSDISCKPMQNYMTRYIAMMMASCTVSLLLNDTEECKETRNELWNYLKKYDIVLYKKVKRSILGYCVRLRGRVGKRVILKGYQIAQKYYGFN